MKKFAGALVGLVVLVAMMAGIIQLNATPAHATIDCPSVCAQQCGGIVYYYTDDCCWCKQGTCNPQIPYCL